MVGLATSGAAHAQSAGSASALPPAVEQALRQAQLPPGALVAVVQEVDAGTVRLKHQATEPVNPASIIKLLTTFAALEELGPSWQWRTPLWLQGRLGDDGTLAGDLHIKGSGDPKLVLERLLGLLLRLQELGVREIRGDIVLDQSGFAPPTRGPADFDGEPLKPYNVQARALMLNQRTVIYSFTPDPVRGVARIGVEPRLAGVVVEATVPLATGACADWRSDLKAQFQQPLRPRFEGRYPASCGERQWPVAHPDPAGYDARLLEQLWLSLGGRLQGRVREGEAPRGAPTLEWASPPLADVVRDINKFSNNTMAQMLLLTLARERGGNAGDATVDEVQARRWLQRWAQQRLEAGDAPSLVIDNGSGLSREQRITAEQLNRLLQAAWRSPVLPDFMASLPVAGTDGTMRRLRSATGRAHLKSGSLRDVVGVAGYVLGHSGRRWALVAIVNHAQAQAARPALDALVQWVAEDEALPARAGRPARGTGPASR